MTRSKLNITNYQEEYKQMTNFKYQEEFSIELAESWKNGNRKYVRDKIRSLKNKAQAAHIAALITAQLEPDDVEIFTRFIHPNNN